MGRVKDLVGSTFFSGKSHLINIYDKYLDNLIKEVNKVAEIGVSQNSLNGWQILYPMATIVGMDSSYVKEIGKGFTAWVRGVTKNYLVIGGCQENAEDLDRLLELGPFDLIIDDASHLPEHQVFTFEYLWPYLNSNGLYIIEDIQIPCEKLCNEYKKVLETAQKVPHKELIFLQSDVPTSLVILITKGEN